MESFIAANPKLVALVFFALMGFVVWVGKRALDNNTSAINGLAVSINAIIDRLHDVENRQSAMESRCDERGKRLNL